MWRLLVGKVFSTEQCWHAVIINFRLDICLSSSVTCQVTLLLIHDGEVVIVTVKKIPLAVLTFGNYQNKILNFYEAVYLKGWFFM